VAVLIYAIFQYSMILMKTIAEFKVCKKDDMYIAEGVDISIVTEASSLDALVRNIEEAVGLYFEGEYTSDSNSEDSLSIIVNYELAQHA